MRNDNKLPGNPRSWGVEADFVPESFADAWRLADAIVALGVRHDSAWSIVGWIACKTRGEDFAAAPTRARYRKILSELPTDLLGPRPSRRRRPLATAERGAAGLTVLGSTAAAGSLGHLVPAPVLAALAGVLVITRTPGTDDSVSELVEWHEAWKVAA